MRTERWICLLLLFCLSASSSASDLRKRVNYWRSRSKQTKPVTPPPSSAKLIEQKIGSLIKLKSPKPVNVTWDVPEGLAQKEDYHLSDDEHTLILPARREGTWTVKLWAVKLDVLYFWPTWPPTFIPPTHIALTGRPELIGHWQIVIRK